MKLNTLFRSTPVSLIYFLLLIPIPLYFILGIINKLGPDPLRFLEHKYGELGLIFLLITLYFTTFKIWKYQPNEV